MLWSKDSRNRDCYYLCVRLHKKGLTSSSKPKELFLQSFTRSATRERARPLRNRTRMAIGARHGAAENISSPVNSPGTEGKHYVVEGQLEPGLLLSVCPLTHEEIGLLQQTQIVVCAVVHKKYCKRTSQTVENSHKDGTRYKARRCREHQFTSQ